MSDTRFETDTLGEIEVPREALYAAQTARAVENFSPKMELQKSASARSMPPRFLHALAHVKKAAALANQQVNELDDQRSNAIVHACDLILSGMYADQFPVAVFQTGSGTSTNMNMNEVLANLASEYLRDQMAPGSGAEISVHPNDHVNMGQSSNDVIPSSLQLAFCIAISELVFPRLDALEQRLNGLSKTYRSAIKTGRTHLMDAVPISLGAEFATWGHQIVECKQRLQSSLARLAALPLGGTAIGTGINSHTEFANLSTALLATQTGMSITSSENLASRISSQDATLEMHGQLKVLATVLMKIANDLRWMNSGPNSGLSEIQLKALQPGSSIMPGKVNPVIPEAIAMLCAEVMGNDTTMTIANQSGNFQLNVMLPLIADKSLASVELLSSALSLLAEKALSDIQVNESHLAETASKNPMLATALNSYIGYEKSAEIAKLAQRDNISVIDAAEKLTDLSRVELEELLDPMHQAFPFDH